MKTCHELRNRLVAGERTDADLAEHLPRCPACARLASRLEAVRGSLRHPPPAPLPDPAFATRVLARLPGSSDLLGWAALRALPAALVLACALAWMSSSEPPSIETLLAEEPSADLLLSASALASEDLR